MANLHLRAIASLVVDSDWGSIVLITNNALIERLPDTLYPPDVTVTGTQVFVGEQQSFRSEKKTVPFFILHDGRPIDIATSHGDASSGQEPGNVIVQIQGIELPNSNNVGDGVNVRVFPRVTLPAH